MSKLGRFATLHDVAIASWTSEDDDEFAEADSVAARLSDESFAAYGRIKRALVDDSTITRPAGWPDEVVS